MLITILLIVILIFSAIIHEYAHGWMAYRLGDETAKQAGRLTLNPIPHLDWIGSILLPFVLIISHSPFFIAWAKPVPYNPNNLRDKKFGDLKVAVAGPIINLIMAFIFGLVIRFIYLGGTMKQDLIYGLLSGNTDGALALTSGSILASVVLLAVIICGVNLMLAFFNLIPIPPLDGSKVLMNLLPWSFRKYFYQLERYGFILLLILLWSGAFNFIFSISLGIFSLLTGIQ